MMRFFFFFFLLFNFASSGLALSAGKLGEKLGAEAIMLIMYCEMSNIGAQDSELGELGFPVTDIDNLIENEIIPIVKNLVRKLNEPEAGKLMDKVIDQLRRFPDVKKDGVKVAFLAYSDQKNMCIEKFGKEKAGVALVIMIHTIIHQKRFL